MNLATFIETFQEAITRTVLRTYPPLYPTPPSVAEMRALVSRGAMTPLFA